MAKGILEKLALWSKLFMLDAACMRHTDEQRWVGSGQCDAPGPLLEPPLLDLARALSRLHAVSLQAECAITAGKLH